MEAFTVLRITFAATMRNIFVTLLLSFSLSSYSQKAYEDSINAFVKKYVETHEVVKGEDRKALQFYPVDSFYRVIARFEKTANSSWISVPTSGKVSKLHKVYGTLSFSINGKPLRLNVYQSQDLLASYEYRNYLFLPFTDSTTGNETYDGGRYIDLSTKDIHDDLLTLDFNKAYNPYCAYVSGKYNCPIPPKENALPVAIKAGEKAFSKAH